MRRDGRVGRREGFAIEACGTRLSAPGPPSTADCRLTAVVKAGVRRAVDRLDALADDKLFLEPEELERLVGGLAQVEVGLDELVLEAVAGEGREAAPVLQVVDLGRAILCRKEPRAADLADNVAPTAVQHGESA